MNRSQFSAVAKKTAFLRLRLRGRQWRTHTVVQDGPFAFTHAAPPATPSGRACPPTMDSLDLTHDLFGLDARDLIRHHI